MREHDVDFVRGEEFDGLVVVKVNDSILWNVPCLSRRRTSASDIVFDGFDEVSSCDRCNSSEGTTPDCCSNASATDERPQFTDHRRKYSRHVNLDGQSALERLVRNG